MFYAVYYISMISEIKKIECELNESGIFGGRGIVAQLSRQKSEIFIMN